MILIKLNNEIARAKQEYQFDKTFFVRPNPTSIRHYRNFAGHLLYQ